jgi:hypothetical protein
MQNVFKDFFNFHDFWGSGPHPTPEIQKLSIKISFVPNALKVIFFNFFRFWGVRPPPHPPKFKKN